MRLYDSSTFHELLHACPQHPTVQFFAPLMQHGVQHYIKNAVTSLYLLEYRGMLLPLTVNEDEYENSYIVSNYYPISSRCERYAHHPTLRNRALYGMTYIAGWGLKALQVNRSIVINNWLLASLPCSELSAADMQKITGFLSEHFPLHWLIVRSVKEDDLPALQESQYITFKVRDFFCYDPLKKDQLSPRARYHRKKDRALQTRYQVLKQCPWTPQDYHDCLKLYQQVYIQKHTKYSPEYTAEFLQHAVATGIMEFTILQQEGKTVGFYTSWVYENHMHVPLLGYDLQHPDAQHIYHLIMTLTLEEAEQKGTWLNSGEGGTMTKQLRGLQSVAEYAAIYGHHLPWMRRSIWHVASYLTH